MKEANHIKAQIKNNSGMGVIEVLIGCAIIVTGMIGLSAAFSSYLKYALANEKNVQATFIAEEGLNIVSILRNKSWDTNIKNLSTTTSTYLKFMNGAWITSTVPEYVDGVFLRQIDVADVVRDASGKISSSGTYDSGTKKITATVLYSEGHATSTRTLSTYITNIYGN